MQFFRCFRSFLDSPMELMNIVTKGVILENASKSVTEIVNIGRK